MSAAEARGSHLIEQRLEQAMVVAIIIAKPHGCARRSGGPRNRPR